jgi:hypothetical protein
VALTFQLILYPVLFIVVLCISVWLRTKKFPQLEVKNTDVLLALLSVILVGVGTGQVESLQFGDLKAVFRGVSQNPVEKDVLPVRHLLTAKKGSIDAIRQLRTRRPEGLQFRLGYKNYSSHVVCIYLEELPSLLYLVVTSKVESQDNRFELLVPSGNLFSGGGCDSKDFVKGVKDEKIELLKKIPGAVSREQRVEATSTKLEALDKMNKSGTQILPVVENDVLVGIVERSTLVSSMVADVTRQVAN